MVKMTKLSLAIILASTIMLLSIVDITAILQEPEKLADTYKDLEKHLGVNAQRDEDLVLLTERTAHPDAQWFPNAGL